MFDFDMPDLDLGSRRRQAEWVSVDSSRPSPKQHKQRRRHRQREKKAKAAAAAVAAADVQPISGGGAVAVAEPAAAAAATPAQAKHNKEFRDSTVVCLSTEIENGNVEYKYCLSGCISNPNRRHQLVTQMKYRLSEGGGECFYYIGVEDDGYPRGLDPKELAASMAIIASMAASLAATARLVEYLRGGFGRRAALMHVKANAEEDMSATDLRVAVAGSMDSGKSTMVAVLTHGSDGRPLLDNCRGSARMAVFRHKHEIESGRTSSISQQVLGYDAEGRVLNYVGVSVPTPADITAAASRVLTFIDMGGHEKYLKTTLYGMTCTLPDYVLLCIDALCGVTRTTREHLAVAVALEVPTALVITKADAVETRQLQSVLQQLRQLMAPLLGSTEQQQQQHLAGHHALLQDGQAAAATGKAAAARLAGSEALRPAGASPDGVPVVLTEHQAVRLAEALSELHSCTAAAASFRQATYPVFTVSCVTGAGLSLLHAFLSRLQPVSTSRSTRQCGTAPAGSSVAGLGADAAAGRQQQVQQQETSAGTLSAAAGSDAVDVQRQLLGMEGSSRLWVAEQPAVEAGVGGTVHSDSLAAAAAAAAPELSTSRCSDDGGDADLGVGVAAVAAASEEAGAAAVAAGHFQVVHTFDVEGVGWVVSGIAVSGTIGLGQCLLWGPTADGGFSPVRVSCIQRSHVPVKQVQPGQTATLALQPAGPDTIPSTSREALLSAAAAAQAAAEAEAAREAAAAVEAAPNMSFGKSQVQAGAAHAGRSAQAPTGAGAAAAGSAAAAVGGAGSCLDDDSRFDVLADDLAAELALEDDEGFDDDEDEYDAATGSGSEFVLGNFGGLDGDAATSSSASFSSATGSSQGAAAACAAAGAGVVGEQRKSRLGRGPTGTGGSICNLGLDLDACFGSLAAAAAGGGGGPGSCASSSCTSLEFNWELGGMEDSAAVQAGAEASSGSGGPAERRATHSSGWLEASLGSSSSFGAVVGLPHSSVSGSSASLGSLRADSPKPAVDTAAAAGRAAWAVPAAAAAACQQGACAAGAGTDTSVGLLGGVPLGCSPSNWRSKGAVLLGAAAAARTYWEFEALLVLLGGHWPARGLLSGCWPPEEQTRPADSTQQQQLEVADAAGRGPVGLGAAGVLMQGAAAERLVAAAAAATPAAGNSCRQRPVKQRSKRYNYAHVIHCNSIRQSARVMHMRELRDEQRQQRQPPGNEHSDAHSEEATGTNSLGGNSSSSSSSNGPGSGNSGLSKGVAKDGANACSSTQQQQQHCSGLSASIQAAAALLQGQAQSDGGSGCGADSGSSGDRARAAGSSRRARGSRVAPGDLGTVVAVRFRFTHRPEWMQVGARLIVRDRSDGHVAAAGFVTALLDAHKQAQQQLQ